MTAAQALWEMSDVVSPHPIDITRRHEDMVIPESVTTTLDVALAALALVAIPATARDTAEQDRVQDSIDALHAPTGASDHAIPEYVLERAEAVVAIPSLIKGGLGFGPEHGKGIMSVRDSKTRR